jgi:hypothetical protein
MLTHVSQLGVSAQRVFGVVRVPGDSDRALKLFQQLGQRLAGMSKEKEQLGAMLLELQVQVLQALAHKLYRVVGEVVLVVIGFDYLVLI